MGRVPLSFWIIFNVVVIGLLVLDLKVFHRKSHVIGFKESLSWAAFWIALAIPFGTGIYFWMGSTEALQFAAGFLIEKSLSVDNLFVFLVIFSYFRVPREYQYKVLFWGIVGALVMRAAFILAGVGLVNRFHWLIYVFGAFLVFTGIKMVTQHGKEMHPEKNPILRIFRRWMPVTPDYHADKFFVRIDGRMYATPMFIVLLVVESTDVLFAVDSIPAIMAITLDPFIIYTSNVFAILGLRALFFALAGMMEVFRYLHYGLSAILIFVGTKMLLTYFDIKLPIGIALGVVVGILVLSVVVSLLNPHQKPPAEPPEPAPSPHA